MDVIEGKCKLCSNEDALIAESKQIIIDLKEAFYNKINEIQDVTNMKICLKCVVKIQFAHKFSKDCKKENDSSQAGKECFVCAETKCVLINTISNPSNFENNMKSFENFAGIQLNSDASVVCLICVHNLTTWVEAKTMLENLNLIENNVETIEHIAEVEENEDVSENAVELIENAVKSIENSVEVDGNEDTPENDVKLIENSAEVERNKDSPENAMSMIENTTEVAVGNEDMPEKPEESLAPEVIDDQDIVKPQITEKEEITHSKWSTYIRKVTKKFEPVHKMNVDVKDISDDTILNKIPYVNITVESQITSISEKNDPIVITDDSSNEKPFKLSKLVQPPDQKKVTYKNLCDVCDKSFETRCDYLSHKLSHEKFEKLAINVPRMNFDMYKYPQDKQSCAPNESLDRLLTKWLGVPAAISSITNTTEKTSPEKVAQNGQSPNPGILSLKKRVLGEDFELMSDNDEFGPNKSNDTSAEFSKLLTDKIIDSDESNPEKKCKETNGNEETVSVTTKLPLTTSDNSSQSELESLRIEDTDEEHAIDSKTSKNEENSRKRKLSDVDEASSDESPKKRAKIAHDEEDIHHDEDEERDAQPAEEQSSQNTNEETEKTEFLKLSKLQRRKSICNPDTALVGSDEEKDENPTITLSSDEDVTVSQEGDDNRTKTIEKRKGIKSNKSMNSSDEDHASEARVESMKKIVEEESKTKKQKTKKDDVSSDEEASDSQDGDDNRPKTVEKRKRIKSNELMNSSDDDDASEPRDESEKKIVKSNSKTKKQKQKTKKSDVSSDEEASDSQDGDDNRPKTVEKRKGIKSNKSMNSSDDDYASETRDESEKNIELGNSKTKKQKQKTKKGDVSSDEEASDSQDGDDNRPKTVEKRKRIKSNELMNSSDDDDASEPRDESEKKIVKSNSKTKKQKQKTKKGDVSSDEDASKSQDGDDNRPKTVEKRKGIKSNKSMNSSDDDYASETRDESEKNIELGNSKTKKQKQKTKKGDVSSDEEASDSQDGDDNRPKTVEKRKRIKSNELMNSSDDDDASATRDESEKKIVEEKSKTKNGDVSSEEDASKSQADKDNTSVAKKQTRKSESIKISSDENASESQGDDDDATKTVEKLKGTKSKKSMSSCDEEDAVDDNSSVEKKQKSISELIDISSDEDGSESQGGDDNKNKKVGKCKQAKFSKLMNSSDEDVSDHESGKSDRKNTNECRSKTQNDQDDQTPDNEEAEESAISKASSPVKESERDKEEKSVIETETNTALATPPKTGQQVTARSSSGKKLKGRRRKPVTLELVDDNSLKKTVESKPKDKEDHPSPEIILELSDPECFEDIEKNLISSDSNSKSPILLDEEYYDKTMKEEKTEVARQSPAMTSTNNEKIDNSKSSNLFDDPFFNNPMAEGERVVSRQSPIMTCEELISILNDDNAKDGTSGKKRARTSSMTDASHPTKKRC